MLAVHVHNTQEMGHYRLPVQQISTVESCDRAMKRVSVAGIL